MSIQVYLISWITLIIRKKTKGKAFVANPKHQYRVSKHGELDCSAHNEKNGDYYKYPSLTYFTNKH